MVRNFLIIIGILTDTEAGVAKKIGRNPSLPIIDQCR